ncbi:MAG: response regulator transcription factor [Chloroflexi bacterium]|nr:response regulator transcription factor [Chloroflexota bacterium]
MQPEEKLSVLLADDHAVVRQGLRAFLELQGDITVVGEAGDGQEAIEMAQELLPDVVLMDLVMPHLDGIEATRQICRLSPGTRVMVLTSFAEDDKLFPAIKAGAMGYLMKDVSPAELAEAVRAVHRGETPLHPEIAKKLMREFADPAVGTLQREDLTDREMDVLALIAQGLSNRDIAVQLVLSPKTVKTHVSNILSKLHLADRTQAAIYALKRGILPSDRPR